jgi:hypothetical protein
MNIYILYKSAFKTQDRTDLGIYQLKYNGEYFFEFLGECSSLNVHEIGGFKGIQFSKFDDKIKRVDFTNNKYVAVE